jgi:hypothetical protein
MSGTTPQFAWPFPTGSDRVMDGDNAIEALARAIEATFSGIRPLQKGSTADLTLGVADTMLPGIAMGPFTPSNPAASEVWLVIGSVFWHATVIGFGDCTATLYVNGVAQGQAMQYSPPAIPDRLTVPQFWLFTVAPGVATGFELRAKCTVAAGTVKARTGSLLTLLRFPLPLTLRGALEGLGDDLEALPAGEELER